MDFSAFTLGPGQRHFALENIVHRLRFERLYRNRNRAIPTPLPGIAQIAFSNPLARARVNGENEEASIWENAVLKQGRNYPAPAV